MKKSILFAAIIAGLFVELTGCSQIPAQGQPSGTPAPVQTVSAAVSQVPAQSQTAASAGTSAAAAISAADAAKAAAGADDSGAPYFVAYEYDAGHFLVSSYQTQQGPGSYSMGGDIYLVDKETGEVVKENQADLSGVDFSKFLAVYSKLSGEIIE